MMHFSLVTLAVLAAGPDVQSLMEHAFYPALLGILVIASLGVPIPEDIPLIAAGVLLKTQPEIATWTGTMTVAMIGIMTGDLVLYRVGRLAGPGVINHRWVRRFVTPGMFARATQQFHRYGMWYCFFGRFFVGIRAAMCMTAGATRYPYWRFFLADFAGALLSVPFFIYLGYWFAGMLPTLKAYMSGVQAIILLVIAVAIAAFVFWRYHRWTRRRSRYRDALALRAERQRTRQVAPVGTPRAHPARRPIIGVESS